MRKYTLSHQLASSLSIARSGGFESQSMALARVDVFGMNASKKNLRHSASYNQMQTTLSS